MARVLWPGDVGPLETTPDRRPGSIRRTMTVDGSRPDGPRGDVVITGRGRDLWTAADGSTVTLAHERLRLRADFVTDQAVKAIEADPGDPALQELVGIGSRRGFRAATGERLPHRRDDGSLLMMLLDDVPIVTSLSRMALHRRGAVSLRPSDPNYLGNRGDAASSAGWGGYEVQCAGWAPSSVMARRVAAGKPPAVSDGFLSPPILRNDDALGWHDVDALGPDGFRRWRRTDLWWLDAEARQVAVDAWWRDTYLASDGDLLVVHEYSVNVTVDARRGVILSCEALPRVLPAPECNKAVPSARRVKGKTLLDMGRTVRAELFGISTCTHLIDELRSIADLHALVPRLVEPEY